jgi:hypothetical protein
LDINTHNVTNVTSIGKIRIGMMSIKVILWNSIQ